MQKTTRRQVIERNLYYWGSTNVKMIGTILLTTLIYGIAFYSSSDNNGELIGNVLFYMMMMEAVFLMIIQITSETMHIPLLLSFGAGRKELLWGMQISNLILWLQAVLLCVWGTGTVWKLLPEEGAEIQLPMLESVLIYGEMLIFGMALGQFGLAINLKSDKKRAVFTGIFMAVYIVFFITYLLFIGTPWMMGREEISSWFVLERQWVVVLEIVFGIVSFGLYLAGVLIIRKMLRRYEVRY